MSAPAETQPVLAALPLASGRRRLGDMATQIRETIQPDKKDERPYLALEHINSGDTVARRHGTSADVRSAKFAFRRGDVLYGKLRPYLDKAVLATFDGVASTELLVLRARPDVDPQFLAFAMHSQRVQKHAIDTTAGVNHPRTSWENLRDLDVYCPPIDEQLRIVRILLTIQRAKDAGASAVDHSQALRVAMTSKFFRNNWPMRPIGSMAKVGNGSTPKRDDPRYWKDGTIPWLTSAKIHEGRIEYADEFVTDTAIQECHLPLVPAGSVLIAITGQGKTLGNAALLAIDSCVSQHLAFIKLTSMDILPCFLHYYLSTRYEDLRSVALGGGSTKGALTCGFLSGYPVPVPAIADQQAVVDALDSVALKLSTERSVERALDVVFIAALRSLMGSGS